MLLNVPLNNALASLSPDGPDAPTHWRRYSRRWTAFNHLRALASLLAAASFSLALAA